MSSNVFGDDLESGYYYQIQLCKADNDPKDKSSKPLLLYVVDAIKAALKTHNCISSVIIVPFAFLCIPFSFQ